jgi:hypothetical protein
VTASYGLRWLEGESTQDGNAKADILGRLGNERYLAVADHPDQLVRAVNPRRLP